ncbi:MAG: L-aspartate oxidase [Phycisphaeraceae bacterium]|nr:L-aspartate oxidase [Phycisphaeraceae bacterium]MCW5763940.1 L-aspartate oxidase [Phycisphaeraceae bacterium]
MNRVIDERRYLIPFRSSLLPQIFTEVLVIGAGVAGLRAAVEAAAQGSEVIVLSKDTLRNTNTAWAQGGIAAILREDDSIESHVQDTLAAGAGLCDEPAVRLVVEQGPERLRELIDWGMALDRDAAGELAVGREGGHNAFRVFHAGGDATGRELERCLYERMLKTGRVRLFDHCFSLDLITQGTEPGAPVLGAITHHERFGLQMIWARTTILASGGAGQLYRETTNPKPATADGLAMAYRAGATLADMAFVQFHPTTLYLPGAGRSLISEAVRGEGAHLLDEAGNRFMLDEHDMAELAPRDIVARAIVRQIARQGGRHVWLDCRHLAHFEHRFPGISAELKRFELDPAQDLIPVHPAAHYMIGGVRCDLQCRTDVPGLLVAGEVSASGLNGANRLASNSLLEGLVFGQIAGALAAKAAASNGSRPGPVPVVSDIRPSDHGELDLADVRSSLRSAMWRNVGIERTGPKLHDANDMFDFWSRYTLDKIFDEPTGWETQNMLLVGSLVAQSGAWREESRGAHARADFPNPVDRFRVHDLWRRGRSQPLLVDLPAEVTV